MGAICYIPFLFIVFCESEIHPGGYGVDFLRLILDNVGWILSAQPYGGVPSPRRTAI